MSITTMEEVFKAGFACGVDEGIGADSNTAWENYRYEILLKTSGKETADDWLKARHQPSTIQNLKCPDCQGEMVPRSSQYGKFWGCVNYPRCKGTRDSEGLSKSERAAQRTANSPEHEDIGPEPDSVHKGSGFTFKKS